MKKKQNTLFLLLLVLVLVIGAIFLVNKIKKANEGNNPVNDKSVVLVSKKKSDVSSFSFTTGDETIAIRSTQTAYIWEGDNAFPLDQTKAGAMAAALASITCDRLVAEHPDDLAEYGLDHPTVTLSAKYSDGMTLTVSIGNYNAFTDSRYLKKDDAVYMISDSILTPFGYSLYDLVVNDTVPSFNFSDVDSILLKRADGQTLLKYAEEEDAWTMTQNGEEAVPADAALPNALYNEATGISLTHCVGYNIRTDEGKAAFGLDEPGSTVTLTYTVKLDITGSDSAAGMQQEQEHTYTLLIGHNAPAEDSEDGQPLSRYVMIDGCFLVYEVPETEIASLIGLQSE